VIGSNSWSLAFVLVYNAAESYSFTVIAMLHCYHLNSKFGNNILTKKKSLAIHMYMYMLKEQSGTKAKV